MKYISEEDLRAYLINDGCDDGCGYLDERDIPSLPWIELDEDEKGKVGHWVEENTESELIEALNAWINDNDRCIDTSFNGEEYCICEHDIEDFCDFLRELNPDLIGIPCMVDTGGIWFKREDLDNARYL